MEIYAYPLWFRKAAAETKAEDTVLGEEVSVPTMDMEGEISGLSTVIYEEKSSEEAIVLKESSETSQISSENEPAVNKSNNETGITKEDIVLESLTDCKRPLENSSDFESTDLHVNKKVKADDDGENDNGKMKELHEDMKVADKDGDGGVEGGKNDESTKKLKLAGEEKDNRGATEADDKDQGMDSFDVKASSDHDDWSSSC